MGTFFAMILARISLKTVILFIITKLIKGITKDKIERVLAAVAQTANEKIDGNAKKGSVRDKVGDIAAEVIYGHGEWAWNILVEFCVAIVKKKL